MPSKAVRLATVDEANAAALGAEPSASHDSASDSISIQVTLLSFSKAVDNDPEPDDDLHDSMDGTAEGVNDNANDNGGQEDQDLEQQSINQDVSVDDIAINLSDENSPDDVGGENNLYDYFMFFGWLEQIYTTAIQGSEQIAICDAQLIRRDQIKFAFWEQMKKPTKLLHDLAFELFDRYGRLNQKYYRHSFKRGSSVWGRELDHGDILLIDSITVISPKRRRGLGTRVIEALLDKTRKKTRNFVALVAPSYLTRKFNYREGDRISEYEAVSKQFFRSLGFRRVGTSSWFAFVDDPAHPSRQLEASDDWDEPPRLHAPSSIFDTSPAVFAIIQRSSHLTDRACLRLLQTKLSRNVQDASWSSTDEKGNNLLHVAAVKSKLAVVEYLLSRRPDLATMRNREGDTPLEALQARLESSRTVAFFGNDLTLLYSDSFTGFDQDSIACIGALSKTDVFDIRQISQDEINGDFYSTHKHGPVVRRRNIIHHSLRMKYGCTCGSCIGGFLSPRMALALICYAEDVHEYLSSSCLPTNGEEWVSGHEHELRFLSLSVQQSLKTNHTMRQGLVSTCSHIASCLEAKVIPNESNVLTSFKAETGKDNPTIAAYCEQGGTVGAVARMVFEGAMDQDEWCGDGFLQMCLEGELEELVECRNDHEFIFVARMCGYDVPVDDGEDWDDI
ncbi:hypothetical protein NQ176_g8604 [Zarea fungicola]|uniref:Uncharacterized protein n=1 Tax=Zarea fungicola TaxID=93591 RepID=A0ACC1MTG3_9HYPO|nr:hypothetical protein NQ176_g8604 [Lecanicillium fungicola]